MELELEIRVNAFLSMCKDAVSLYSNFKNKLARDNVLEYMRECRAQSSGIKLALVDMTSLLMPICGQRAFFHLQDWVDEICPRWNHT